MPPDTGIKRTRQTLTAITGQGPLPRAQLGLVIFRSVSPLPGILPSLHLDTPITLPWPHPNRSGAAAIGAMIQLP